MSKAHQYSAVITWTGNTGKGTSGYKSYERQYTISTEGKPEIMGSSDPAFRGDPSKYNPEDLLVASLSSCHMLWFLHLCTVNNIIVTGYKDQATGIMEERQDGSGAFKEVVLNPVVEVAEESMIAKANALHHDANKMCFIANSCNFPIKHNPQCIVKSANHEI